MISVKLQLTKKNVSDGMEEEEFFFPNSADDIENFLKQRKNCGDHAKVTAILYYL